MTSAMPRIRTLLIDDEPAARDALHALLARDADVVVIGECADGSSALEMIRTESPDLIFLDVQMPEMDGFGVLQALEPSQFPVVVFVTAYDQHALHAFEVHAVDYLLKPFTDERFWEAVSRAKQQVRHGKLDAVGRQLAALLSGVGAQAAARHGPYLKRFVVKDDGRVTIVSVADVEWIEAEGDYAQIHAGRATHRLRETMKNLEDQLDPSRFVRIHRSTIVNVDRIKELQPFFRGEYVVILSNGTSLKLSRGYKQHLERVLGHKF
jgi:two-component system LytT family response regulator